MKRLIINADDYGYTSGVSVGIRLAHRDGIVTSTSVMMPMPYAQAALQELKAESPSLGTGVHLTLTAGVPFRLAAFPNWKELDSALGEMPITALRDEWQAQIDAFLTMGLPLTHLDSHGHATYRHENALSVMLELARQYGVPVRNPYPLAGVKADFAEGLFGVSGVRFPAHFCDVFDGRTEPCADALLKAFDVLDEGVTEFMVHPAIVDDELRRLWPDFAEPRAKELSALTDSCLGEAVRHFGVELVDFGALSSET